MRKFRRTHDLTPEQKKKDNCRSYAGTYFHRGFIKQRPCNSCGDKNSQMHHEDYDRPLWVVWFCRKCHLALHREENEEKYASKLKDIVDLFLNNRETI